MRPDTWFENNCCKDTPLGSIERMFLTDPSLDKSVDYVDGALVNIRTCTHIREDLRWLLGQITRYHAASGVYSVRVCRTGELVIFSRYELLPALSL